MRTPRPGTAWQSPAFRSGWARLLDPAAQPHSRRPPAPTVYRPDRLLIHPGTPAHSQAVRAAVDHHATKRNWSAVASGPGLQLQPLVSGEPVDAWAVLADLKLEQGAGTITPVGLDHLMTTAEQLGGNPFAIAHGQPGLDHYGIPGYAGRGPVSALLAPRRRPVARTPRVVVLDTGIGIHPWFQSHRVITTIDFLDGSRCGPSIDSASITAVDAEGRGVGNHLLGLLADHSGHGTFIAGLLRQTCPESEIVALAVMGSDGMVAESTLTDALQLVLDKQLEFPGWTDAIVLSLGYYAETADDLTYTTGLGSVLGRLAAAGVAIFCAAGNDATTRPSFPAAFAGQDLFAAPTVMPLASVAALNPDGTVAEFSNDGAWVNAEALGVNVVSTAPIRADGSELAAVSASGPGRRARSGSDPDGFHSGFASWSGTSFAAPDLAGRFLQALVRAGMPTDISERRRLVGLGRGNRGGVATTT